MNPLEAILQGKPFAVLDGAFATELERLGFSIDDPLWSAKAIYERPDLVGAVHRMYLEAGADIVESAGYQASVPGFMKKGFSRKEAEELLARSVRIVKAACADFQKSRGRKALAAASIGPYGACLADGSEYRGDYKAGEEELYEFHRERLSVLAREAPDLYAFETFPLLKEAKAACRALAGLDGASGWVSFSCRDGETTCGGDDIGECAAFLDKVPQIAAIGVNCIAPRYAPSLIRRIRAHTDKPCVVYPNSGEVYDPGEEAWHGQAEEARHLARICYEAGARIIGGCCRTTPETIREIAAFRAGLSGERADRKT